MTRVLVTGGGGFIGGAVARSLLARGEEVTSFSRGAYPELEALGIRTVRGDLADADAVAAAVAGHDVVVHTAAKAGAWGPAAEYRRPNVVGTRSVVDACRRHGVGRLVFTSSPSVVYRPGDVENATEDLPYPQRYPAAYPATKAAAERMVLAANGGSLATVALRPHLVWGPGDPHLVPGLVDRARRGRLPIIGSGDNLVDTTYIDNAAQAHVDALDRLVSPAVAPAGRAYFIAQGEPVPMREMLNRILATAGVPPLTRRVPVPVALAVGAVAEAVHGVRGGRGEPLLTRFLVRQLSSAHWFDLTAAHRDLGYRARVSLAEGLERLRSHQLGTGPVVRDGGRRRDVAGDLPPTNSPPPQR